MTAHFPRGRCCFRTFRPTLKNGSRGSVGRAATVQFAPSGGMLSTDISASQVWGCDRAMMWAIASGVGCDIMWQWGI
eukprot:1166461-Prymnesium_polylepis.1